MQLQEEKRKEKKNHSGTGNRTPSCRVKDGDVYHYTMPDAINNTARISSEDLACPTFYLTT